MIATEQPTSKLTRPEPPDARREPLVIVGAGFAGLCAAAAARARGVDPLVLDAAGEVGGAWARMPAETVCISPRIRDRLPDGSTPHARRDHATAPQVCDAIQSYAERSRFRVELGARVMAAEPQGQELRLRTTGGEIVTPRLVVATGEFGAPRVPHALAARFEGVLQHSAEFRASQVMPHERVVVIGSGNSGAEVALAALARGARVTMCASRELERPRGACERGMLGDLKWLASGVPVQALPRRAGCRARVKLASPALWDAARSGRLRVEGRALAVEARVVRVETGEVIAADRVVLATGFRRDLEFLGDAIRLDAEGLPLHRGGLSADLRAVAFVGLPCLRTRRSGFLRGFTADARAVVGRLLARA